MLKIKFLKNFWVKKTSPTLSEVKQRTPINIFTLRCLFTKSNLKYKNLLVDHFKILLAQQEKVFNGILPSIIEVQKRLKYIKQNLSLFSSFNIVLLVLLEKPILIVTVK
jgi:hypothetical protein